jgi:ubiquinone/menaquinone biosynthesis C-methylase UbiE
MKLNIETRKLYHKQHSRMLKDTKTYNRIMNIPVNESFFKLSKNYFNGKQVLDVGCGSIVRNSINFQKLGSEKVIALDLGKDWFSTANRSIKQSKIPKNTIILESGSCSDLPYKDEVFDFVCCDGVLPHLVDINQVKKTLGELTRVTKSKGYLFVSFMAGGGLIETKIIDSIRGFYRENKEFKKLIDNINPNILNTFITFILSTARENGQKLNAKNEKILKELLDEDLCISMQNTIQCEKRECHQLTFVKKFLLDNDFYQIRRLKRYVIRNNIRKYFSPLHFDSDNKFSKILYGDGWVDLIARKR